MKKMTNKINTLHPKIREEVTATKKFACYNTDCTLRRSKPTLTNKKAAKKGEDEIKD